MLYCGACAFDGCSLSRGGCGRALRQTADEYVAKGLYSGLACASTHGAMYVCGMRTLDEPRLPVTPEELDGDRFCGQRG